MSYGYGWQPPQEPPTPRDVYDMLAAMVERIPWRDEAEMLQWRALVARLRDLNIFGYIAATTTARRGDR